MYCSYEVEKEVLVDKTSSWWKVAYSLLALVPDSYVSSIVSVMLTTVGNSLATCLAMELLATPAFSL